MKKFSRRKFLKLAGTAAAGVLATACNVSPASTQKTSPVDTQAVTPATAAHTSAAEATQASTPAAADAAVPTATQTTTATKTYWHPEVIQFYPAVKSKVIQAHDPKVWNADTVDPAAVRGLVDKSITALTGIEDVKKAWQALFKPTEKIAIKVNVFRNSTIWTHYELVKAVTDSLQEAGIPAEQITIFDYYTSELETAKYPVNKDMPGVRCYGSDDAYTTQWKLENYSVQLSDILANCDALINMPVLKSHMIAGFTFALKNHYGSVAYPNGLHNIDTCLPLLNLLTPIRETTRLVIGDVLHANTQYANSWPYWEADVKGDSILMSFDPLAHDVIGQQVLVKLAKAKGSPGESIQNVADRWIKAAASAGLGAGEAQNIDFVEI